MEEHIIPEETQDNNRIVSINIEEQMKMAYIDYSMSVIVSRALPDVREQFFQQGLDPESNTPEQFAQVIRDDYARWSKIIHAAGIKLE